MKIEEAEPSSSGANGAGSEMPPASAELLRNIIETKTDEQFIEAINKGREVHAVMGKTELYKWTEVLNRCDEILGKAVVKNEQGNMLVDCDKDLSNQVVSVIRFTVLLFECTSSRRIYKSVDRILSLLESTDMDTLAEVLRLLQVMGKRSKFLSTRIPQKEQHALAHRLTAIAQCWSGKLRTVKMAECLKREPKLPSLFPFTYTDDKQRTITVEQPKIQEGESVGELITRTGAQLSPLTSSDSVPNAQFSREDGYCLLSRLRMLVRFDVWKHRFKCLVVRLLSVSTLVYCRLSGTDENTINSLLYSGFIEEIVDLLKAEREPDSENEHSLYDAIQTEALSTLCSIATYEKEPKITQILEALSAGSYHGFLSVMTRQIVDELKSNNLGKPGKPSVFLATSLFSFIYHLASIEPGGDTLVGSGLTQTLLSVIGFHELPIDCITFGTRCARIIDLFTTIDVTAFKANNGMEICVNRVVHEVNECRKEQPFVIDTSYDPPFVDEPEPEPRAEQGRRDGEEDGNEGDDEEDEGNERGVLNFADPVDNVDLVEEFEILQRNFGAALAQGMIHDHVGYPMPAPFFAGVRPRQVHDEPTDPRLERPTVAATESLSSTSTAISNSDNNKIKGGPWEQVQHNGTSCHQQRSGLIKGLLTFIKRAIGDVQLQDVMRHLMGGDLPEALMHILSNAEYYSPSLFHQSAHLITNFVYQFPDELSSLQRRHVPYVIFQSLLRKELPNSKDVITTLGSVFTAMCFNERGLRQFKSYDPFDQIFRIVLSVKFLVTLRKKRSSEAFESAQAIGGALDDLMRHSPDLKHDMLKSIIIILDLLDEIGRTPPAGVELVPTLTKTMARSVVLSSNSSLLPREAHEAREETPRASGGGAPEQADERVGGDTGEEEEEPMEVEDGEDSDVDEDDNEMSMDEMSGEAPIVNTVSPAAPSPKPVAPKPFEYGPGMMCEDGNGKKILPIGDYMLLIARVVETMMTQSPSQRFTDEFIQSGGMQKIMKLCHLPCITNESTHSTYITTIANIVKHIVKAGFTGQRNGQESGPKLMAAIIGEFIKTIEPFFEVNNGDFSAMKAADSKKATILMHLDEKLVEKTLVELNSLVPILLNLNKNAPQSYTPQDQRNRLFETWKMPDGVKLYGMLRKLSRMLSWEHELIQTLKPTIRTAATQTDGDALSDQLGGDSHLDAEVLPPWDEKEEKVKENEKEECKDARWKAAGVSQEEHDFWLKNKSLQDIVSKSHHLVKELLNSMGKQINLPTMRRPRPRDPAQLPMAATACISMIFNSIYKDLKWEPPGAANSSMAYGRYIELLTQLNFSLFENNTNARCTNPALAQFFYTSGCHKAFFELFTDKIIPFLGDDMPAGVEQTMEEWCRLAVKLTDRNSIVSGDQLMHRRDRSLPEFDTNKYLKLVCRDMFNVYKQFFEKMAQMPDFELKSLKKVCENAFAVFKEVAKNLVEETELAAAAAAASAASAAASAVPAASSAADAPPEDWAPGVPFRQVASNSEAPPAAPPPPPAVAAHPQEDQIVMMMDLGFSREIVTYAVENTRSVDEAANYLLAHGHEIRAQEVINAFRDEAPIHLALVQQAIGGSAAPAAGSTSAAIPNVEEIERRLNEHLSEVSHDDVLSGDELVRSAQRVLDTMGLVSISEQLSDACPNDGSEMSSERVVNAALDLVRNSRTPLFEENIATPLIPPLSQLKIDQDVSLNSACKQLFPLVNRLLLVSNDTIHPCAELIISIFPAMTEEWRKEHLIATIIGQDLIKMLGNLVEQEVDDNEVPRKHEVARTMANRLHFAVLIFDKVGEEYVEWINSTTIVDNMLKSLDYLVRRINNVEYYQSLITRIVCWFDFYAKIQRFISRRKFLKSLAPTLEWHFQQVEEDTLRRRAEFPNGERKWVAFDQQSQKILNDAFFSGVRWAKLSLKRPGRTPRKTEVDFITMKHFDGNTSTSRENVKADLPANVDINIKDLMTSEASLSFTNVNNDRLLRLATDVIRSGNLDPKCSHSMLSFIARLTRAPHNANQFLENGGVEALLQLRARCSPTYPFLVSMILRHCIDDDSMSSVIYEKTLRAYIASSSPQSSSSVADYSPSKPKDFVETLQLFSAMSSWNPLVFTEVINKIARTQDNDIVLMTKEKEKKATSGPTTSSTCTSSSHPTIVENNYRSLKVIHLMIIEIFEGHFPTSGSGQSRMLSKEKILSILSEIIKSYPSLAVVISEMRHGEQAEMTVMHKLIDTYVSPSPENVETANALKTLIAVISAAQNAGKAQESLVMDIKNALAIYSDKALDMRGEGVILQQENELRPEEREAAMNAFKTDEKEVLQKIQDLCAIIVTMCQSCPPQHHHHHHHHHHTTSDRNRSNHQNSVMKLFHKKKICADLVKTIHSLQLGTKESLDTVNQILKTLDTLLEGAGQNQNSLPALPRSFIEMVAGRRAGTRDREVAGGVGVHERQDLDNLIGHDAGFAFDGEMRQLLRRLNDETFRGVGVGAGAARARVAQQAGDDNDGEEEEEEEEEGSETSETSQNDAVQGNEEGVEVVVAEAIPVPIQEDEHEEDENLRVDIIGEEEDGEEEDNEDDDDDDDADDDGDGEDDEEDSEGDQGEQPGGGVGPHIIDLDDIDEDADDEEDERLEQEIMNDDEGAVRILQAANGEPSRRLLVDDDEDDDDDGDEDSMEDDGARLDLDDDYFGIGGHFGDIHRVDDMLFQHSFGRGPISAIADIFRDEIDYLPSYRPERRLTAPRSTFGVVSEHPLLTRPPSDSDVPRRLPPTSYRAEILMHGPGGRTALHRQNAIRRTTTETRELEAISRGIRMSELQPGRMVVRGGEVLHPTSFFDHIFDIRPTNVSFSQRMAAYRNYNSAFQDSREERRDARATQVPNILERLDSYMNSMDPVSVRFVTVIVNSLLTKFHKAREAQIKKEAEAKAKAKKEAESAKKAAEEKKLGAHIRRHAQAAAAASPATLAETPAPTPAEMGLATPATTNTTITVSDTVAPTPASASSGAEPMETGDEVPQSSAATAASSVAGVEELEEDAPEAVPPPSQDQEPPAAPSEEFREILGDIDVPDGVDPAFLAALPEEMRAEVIRDYQRQQRAERASRPVAPAPAQPAASAAAAPADGADAPPQEEAPAAPLVEPIDPVFLNALPPELQEEVLAEHERRLREAEEQQRRRQNATAAPVVEMDGAAVIASLPLNERAQVLAEMDETELAGLPSEMQNEARRARATHIEPNLAARYQRFLFRGAPVSAGLSMRGGGGGRGGAARPVANAGPVVGAQAGNAYQAPSDHAHLLDRESILTLCMLYLVDNNRVPHTRLQKVLRSACVNQATCDFIIWCLLALLDKASDANSDDEEINSIVPAYLDSIAVSGVGHNERALRIAENAQKVSIHSMLAVPMCKNILDLLASIARAYPGNFLPALLRRGAKPADVGKQSPTFHQFWTMVQNSSKAPKTKECTATPEQQLESCPLGQMLDSLQKPTMAKSPLKEKVLKVASQIMVTLPMDTLSLLKAKRDDDDDGEDKKPLSQKLEYVIRVMTTGSCATEGLNDGLTILSEAMRTFDDSTSITIYDHLFSAVTKLGEQLLPQIDHLIVELDEAQSQSQSQVQKLEDEQPSTSKTAQLVVDISGRTATGRFDGERLVIDGDQNTRLQMSSCKELQLPAVTVLTDKGGAQYALLSALQTLVKVRTYMKAIRKDKAKREAKKSKEPSVDTPAPTEDVANEGTVPPPPAEAVAAAAAAEEEEAEEQEVEEPRISDRLASLESLWCSLSECLLRLGKASDPHAVLALQPAAEAFFLVHASQQQQQQQHKSKKEAATEVTKRTDGGQSTSTAVPAAVATSFSHEGLREDFDPDTTKLIEFAEKHRQVLNQALRQNNAVLSTGGPFAILTQFPKLLDFDVKRKFFRKELTKLEPSMPRYRRNDVSVQVSRNRVFSDSFRELFRLRPSEWKNRFYIIFQGEEGQDAGGLLREWFSVITREIFNPNYALFITAPGDMVTYMINKASYINPEHLDYFKFVGRLIAKSVFEHKYLDCYFTRAFYKHILNLPVRYQDLESEDPAFFKSLDFLLQNPIDDLVLDLTFSTEVEEFGVRSVRDLKPNGRKIEVTDANKDEYVKLVCQMKMTGSIRQQLDAFLTGFYEIIPKDLISMFNEQELELLISGLPTVDIDDMAANTDYKGYQKTSTHIQWFWRALRSFEKEDKAKFLQFVTGTSKVPLQGFASLEGMNGVQKFSIHCDSRGGDRLPAAHTCFNQLDLPQYESYDKLRHSLLLAIRECSEGFGFA